MNDKMPTRCLNEEKLPDDGFCVNEVIQKACIDENYKPWTREIGVFHPSSIKGCLRALYYDMTRVEPKPNIPPSKRMLFDIGHAIHAMIQEKLAGVEGFEAEVRGEFAPLKITGSCDGIFRKEDWLLEIKTTGESTFKRLTKPKVDHIWQVHCYMWMFDIPRSQLLYVNRNTGEMRMFVVEFDYSIWEKIIDRINEAERAIRTGEPPDFSRNSFFCSTCKFYYHCQPPAYKNG